MRRLFSSEIAVYLATGFVFAMIFIGAQCASSSTHPLLKDRNVQMLEHGDLAFGHGRIKIAGPAAKAAAGYVIIRNTGPDDRLKSVSSPNSANGTLHHIIAEDEVMRMEPVLDGLPLPTGTTFAFEPGGTHIMFMGLDAEAFKQSEIAVIFEFERAGKIELMLPVLSLIHI